MELQKEFVVVQNDFDLGHYHDRSYKMIYKYAVSLCDFSTIFRFFPPILFILLVVAPWSSLAVLLLKQIMFNLNGNRKISSLYKWQKFLFCMYNVYNIYISSYKIPNQQLNARQGCTHHAVSIHLIKRCVQFKRLEVWRISLID